MKNIFYWFGGIVTSTFTTLALFNDSNKHPKKSELIKKCSSDSSLYTIPNKKETYFMTRSRSDSPYFSPR